MAAINIDFDVPFEEAIAAALARNVVLPELYYNYAQNSARSMAFSVSGMVELDQLQMIFDSLNESIKNGTTFKEWKKTTPGLLKFPKHQLDNIFRTNIQGAYAKGHWVHQEQYVRSRPYLMYSAINDSRVRPRHSSMNGHVAPVHDPVWNRWYPLNGYRCRCSVISLSERQAKRYIKKDTERLRDNPELSNERLKAEPDKGWSYHGGKDYLHGIKQALNKRIAGCSACIPGLKERAAELKKLLEESEVLA